LSFIIVTIIIIIIVTIIFALQLSSSSAFGSHADLAILESRSGSS
jgi:hypothetical protein